MIGNIYPPEIMHVFQMKLANTQKNKWMFIGAGAQINAHQSINLLMGNLWSLAMFLCVNYKLWKYIEIISKILIGKRLISYHFVENATSWILRIKIWSCYSWFHAILVYFIMESHTHTHTHTHTIYIYIYIYIKHEWKTPKILLILENSM